MSLLIDDDHITTSDLLAIDPEVSDIATAEEITIEDDGGIARQAWDECSDRLMECMKPFGDDAFYTPGLVTIGQSRVKLHQIVVSSQYGRRASALRRWMIYHALELFYRAAMNRRVSDRYEEKYERMREDTRERWRVLFGSGLPFVVSPMPCPGAVHEIGAGNFGASNLAYVEGGADAEAEYSVAITWTDGTVESGPSKTLAATVPQDQLLRVSIAGLTPPRAVDGRRAATGWNVYVGTPGGTLYRQNAVPVAVGTSTYTLVGAPVLSGTVMGTGQAPDSVATFQTLLQRG